LLQDIEVESSSYFLQLNCRDGAHLTYQTLSMLMQPSSDNPTKKDKDYLSYTLTHSAIPPDFNQ
jgi:hypothetical protein